MAVLTQPLGEASGELRIDEKLHARSGSSRFTSLGSIGLRTQVLQVFVVVQDLVYAHSRAQEIEDHVHGIPEPTHGWRAVADAWIDRNASLERTHESSHEDVDLTASFKCNGSSVLNIFGSSSFWLQPEAPDFEPPGTTEPGCTFGM